MESPFDRIGGEAAVASLVEDFYRRIEADPEIRPVYPEDLGPGKAKFTLYLGEWLGGPPAYTDRYGHPRLRRRHFPFVIEAKHAGIWLKHMREAVQSAEVPREIEEMMFERLGPLAQHMVNATEDVPREPLGEARLT